VSFFKNLVAKIVAGRFKAKLDAIDKENNMDEVKKWYKSRNVWTGIVTVLIGIYSSIDASLAPSLGFNLPDIPEFVYVILGTLGVYTRVTAEKKVG